MNKLLIASNNQAKVEEYKRLLKDIPIELVTLSDIGIDTKVQEHGKTFEENAEKKARAYSKISGLPTLADDGGLEIDYLDGEPGVLSRRWPGYEASDDELVEITLTKLAGVPWEKRAGQLRVVVAIKFPDEEKVYTAEGTKRGFIHDTVQDPIQIGYPFRSLFYIPELKKTYCKLTAEEEARLAHRVGALQELETILREKLCST